jgi:hypothetical protein
MQGRRALLSLALAALAASGCAVAQGALDGPGGGPLVYRRGEIAPGRYLVTVVVGADQCRAAAGPCTTSDDGTVRVALSRVPQVEDWVYEAYAHELCHVVAGLHALVGPLDPCHKEDGGRMHATRGPFRRVATSPR